MHEFKEGPTDGPDALLEEFMTFWSMAMEKTSSSYSSRHFGHYKAVSHPSLFSHLHVDSINVAIWYEKPLQRWRKGVTILLEKEHGKNFIGKLQAVCLLEAN